MSIKVNNNINIEGDLFANNIIKVGGTSSQFLKADGSIDSNQYVNLTTDQTIGGYKSFNKGIIGSQKGGMIVEGVEGHIYLNMPDIISNLGGIAKWASNFPNFTKISFKRNASSTTRLVLRITTGFVSNFCDILVTMYQQSNSNTYKRVQFLGGRLSVFNQCEFYLEYDSVTEEEIIYTKINFSYPSLTPLSLQAVGGDAKLTQESFSIGFTTQTEVDNSNALLIGEGKTIGSDFVDLFYNQTISGNKTFNDNVQAANFIGNGSQLTNLNYNNISNPPTLNFDNYAQWNLKTNGIQRTTIKSNDILNLVGGENVSLSYSAGGVVTINSSDTNTIPSNATINISGTNGLAGNISFTLNQATEAFLELEHGDTSNFSMIALTESSVISDINVDAFGHITEVSSRNLTAYDVKAQPADIILSIVDYTINGSENTIINSGDNTILVSSGTPNNGQKIDLLIGRGMKFSVDIYGITNTIVFSANTLLQAARLIIQYSKNNDKWYLIDTF